MILFDNSDMKISFLHYFLLRNYMFVDNTIIIIQIIWKKKTEITSYYMLNMFSK